MPHSISTTQYIYYCHDQSINLSIYLSIIIILIICVILKLKAIILLGHSLWWTRIRFYTYIPIGIYHKQCKVERKSPHLNATSTTRQPLASWSRVYSRTDGGLLDPLQTLFQIPQARRVMMKCSLFISLRRCFTLCSRTRLKRFAGIDSQLRYTPVLACLCPDQCAIFAAENTVLMLLSLYKHVLCINTFFYT